jgi:hypothetical protein
MAAVEVKTQQEVDALVQATAEVSQVEWQNGNGIASVMQFFLAMLTAHAALGKLHDFPLQRRLARRAIVAGHEIGGPFVSALFRSSCGDRLRGLDYANTIHIISTDAARTVEEMMAEDLAWGAVSHYCRVRQLEGNTLLVSPRRTWRLNERCGAVELKYYALAERTASVRVYSLQ